MDKISTQNIIKDLSALGASEHLMNRLVERADLCIAHEVLAAKRKGEEIVKLGIGVGSLIIDLKSNQVKFSPSKELQTLLKKAVTEQIDSLEITLEQEMIDKLNEMIAEVI